jgi:hypothetical protein
MPDNAPDPPKPRLEALRGPNFEKYALIRANLGIEPIEWITNRRLAGRSQLGGEDLPRILLSFRDLAPELTRASGVTVTYETIRRWWDLAYPDGHPGAPDGTVRPYHLHRAPRGARPDTPAPAPDTVAAAEQVARDRHTNATVPPAAFVEPGA